MMNFSIIIPVYNEEFNINKLIEEIFENLLEFKNNFEVILVNDASLDDSLKVIGKIQKKYPNVIKTINNNQNIGQSYSLIEGIKKSSYEIIVTLDGDGQNNPKDIPILLNKYLSDSNLGLVGGIRARRKDSLIKIISSKVANSFRQYILKDNCQDTGCSLKVFNKAAFMKFPFFNGIHRFLPALYKGYGFNTFFIKVDHRPRNFGYSKYGTFGRLFRGIRDLIKVIKILNKIKNK